MAIVHLIEINLAVLGIKQIQINFVLMKLFFKFFMDFRAFICLIPKTFLVLLSHFGTF